MKTSTRIYLHAAKREDKRNWYSCLYIADIAAQVYGVHQHYLALQESIDYQEMFELHRCSKNSIALYTRMTPLERQIQRVWMLLIMAAISENP